MASEVVPYPDPDQPFGLDAYRQRWPTGAEKVALVKGHQMYVGDFGEIDVAAAERAFPERKVTVDDGCLIVHLSGCSKDCDLWPG